MQEDQQGGGTPVRAHMGTQKSQQHGKTLRLAEPARTPTHTVHPIEVSKITSVLPLPAFRAGPRLGNFLVSAGFLDTVVGGLRACRCLSSGQKRIRCEVVDRAVRLGGLSVVEKGFV
ncbi:hypothetical protein GCM10018773_50190 [Streptomyces candidus]|nr:hypothetical protein GCM10018773_50190 [Streptomyces candidus]